MSHCKVAWQGGTCYGSCAHSASYAAYPSDGCMPHWCSRLPGKLLMRCPKPAAQGARPPHPQCADVKGGNLALQVPAQDAQLNGAAPLVGVLYAIEANQRSSGTTSSLNHAGQAPNSSDEALLHANTNSGAPHLDPPAVVRRLLQAASNGRARTLCFAVSQGCGACVALWAHRRWLPMASPSNHA